MVRSLSGESCERELSQCPVSERRQFFERERERVLGVRERV